LFLIVTAPLPLATQTPIATSPSNSAAVRRTPPMRNMDFLRKAPDARRTLQRKPATHASRSKSKGPIRTRFCYA
jgi:hypothetical protein